MPQDPPFSPVLQQKKPAAKQQENLGNLSNFLLFCAYRLKKESFVKPSNTSSPEKMLNKQKQGAGSAACDRDIPWPTATHGNCNFYTGTKDGPKPSL